MRNALTWGAGGCIGGTGYGGLYDTNLPNRGGGGGGGSGQAPRVFKVQEEESDYQRRAKIARLFGFNIANDRCFHIKFSNGWRVSSVVGLDGYSDTAEVRAWHDDGEHFLVEESDEKKFDAMSPEDLLAFMNKVAAFPAKAPAKIDEDEWEGHGISSLMLAGNLTAI